MINGSSLSDAGQSNALTSSDVALLVSFVLAASTLIFSCIGYLIYKITKTERELDQTELNLDNLPRRSSPISSSSALNRNLSVESNANSSTIKKTQSQRGKKELRFNFSAQ